MRIPIPRDFSVAFVSGERRQPCFISKNGMRLAERTSSAAVAERFSMPADGAAGLDEPAQQLSGQAM
jgi:hypothetical protein